MIGLIGSEGNIGSRYAAILKHLKIEFTRVDTKLGLDPFLNPRQWSKVIIATPTNSHYMFAEFFKSEEIPFLLEKPPTLVENEALLMSAWSGPFFIVNNYDFIVKNPKRIEYDHYRTGSDGLAFDCCQLLYLADRFGAGISIKNESPIWTLKVDRKLIAYREIEMSYISMLRSFVSGFYERLLPIKHAYPMFQSAMDFE